MARIVGIDVGTSGARAILVDETGKVLRSASQSYPVSMPYPGWAEQDPETWWQAVSKCLLELDTKPDAIGVAGQMHGSVFLDSHGNVVRPALLWCDQRTTDQIAEIESAVGSKRVWEITGNPPLTGFQLPKILWLRRHEPENFARVKKILLPKDYIVYKLTGEFCSDVSDASGTGFLNLNERNWSAEILEQLSLPLSLFPEVFESPQVVGQTAEGVPVVAGAGDQVAGAVGVGAVSPGIVSLSLGTSGVAFASLEKPIHEPSGSAHIFCHGNGKWHAMGVMLSCGGAVSWCRDTFFEGQTFDEMARLAQESSVGADGLSFLPYLSGERCPHIAPKARGAFVGLTMSHSRKEIARSVFEGVTYGLKECLDLMLTMEPECQEVRVTGGGANSDFWMQMISDITGKTCVRLSVEEGPALGAAILAGVGTGVWPQLSAATEAIVKKVKAFSPSGSDYSESYSRYRNLYPLLKDWYH